MGNHWMCLAENIFFPYRYVLFFFLFSKLWNQILPSGNCIDFPSPLRKPLQQIGEKLEFLLTNHNQTRAFSCFPHPTETPLRWNASCCITKLLKRPNVDVNSPEGVWSGRASGYFTILADLIFLDFCSIRSDANQQIPSNVSIIIEW